jgi:tetratricopeptide (TPR) repeat protein
MPQRAPTDVAHAALTDHRILARPNTREPPTLSAPQEIVAWREPPAEFQKRDLGLAYLESAAIFSNQHFEGLGGNLLKDLAVAQQNEDAPVLAALGNFNLSQGHPAEAVAFFRQACDIAPLSGSFAMLLGISLKQSADTEAAINELRRAIRLDPSQERSYFELSALYAKDGRLSDAKDILSEYLKWNPQSVLGRLTRDTLNGSKKGRTNQGSSAPRLYE